MRFQTLGQKGNKTVLCIPGMFCTSESCLPFADLLKDEYYVILPTLDGHYRGSDPLVGGMEEAKKIVSYLQQEKIESLEMLHGTSMGAEIALAVAAICNIPVKHFFFDGGPFFKFPKVVKFTMFKKFEGLMKKCHGKTEEEALHDPFVKKLGGDDVEHFRGMVREFIQASEFVTKEDIKAVTEICYDCPLPSFKEETQKRFFFLFSKGEPAHMSKKRVHKNYPYAQYKDYPGNTHCGFQVSKPEQYAKFLKQVLKG